MFDRKALKAKMILEGKTAEDVAGALGINITTFYLKLKDDGRFSRHEISRMIDYLHIEDPDSIFFAKELREG